VTHAVLVPQSVATSHPGTVVDVVVLDVVLLVVVELLVVLDVVVELVVVAG
jgi:hypothetical protein